MDSLYCNDCRTQVQSDAVLFNTAVRPSMLRTTPTDVTFCSYYISSFRRHILKPRVLGERPIAVEFAVFRLCAKFGTTTYVAFKV